MLPKAQKYTPRRISARLYRLRISGDQPKLLACRWDRRLTRIREERVFTTILRRGHNQKVGDEILFCLAMSLKIFQGARTIFASIPLKTNEKHRIKDSKRYKSSNKAKNRRDDLDLVIARRMLQLT
jgi:hypothetical protein